MSPYTSDTPQLQRSKSRFGVGLFILLFLPSIYVFGSPLRELVALSLGDKRYSHILVIPCISLALMYWQRCDIFRHTTFSPSIGIPLLSLGIVGYGALIWSALPLTETALSLAIFCAILVWIGIFVLCFGSELFKLFRFPILLLLLLVPIPSDQMDKIIFVLQSGSAEVSYAFFKIAGVPVFRQGFTFDLPIVGVEVAKECSSIHSGVALFITSLLLGHVFLRSLGTKVCLSVLTVPIAVFANAIRIFSLWWLATHVDMSFLTGNLHHRGGIVFSMNSLAMLLVLVGGLWKFERRGSSPARMSKKAAVVAG